MSDALDPQQQKSLNDLLTDAVSKGNQSRVAACITHGAQTDYTVTTGSRDSYNFKRRPVSHYAYEHYDPAVMDTLARAGMPLEARNDDGDTVLGLAVRNRNIKAVEQLLSLGASPLSANKGGTTILDLARKAANGYEAGSPAAVTPEKIIDMLIAALPVAQDAFNDNAPREGVDGKGLTTGDEFAVRRKPLVVTPKGGEKPQSGKNGQGGFSL
ncbi:MAG: hypothetical protein GC185_04450 [Alphaproteobacteria bacterium]|nr:hypothetical protein [Alphaproteobacteria bacterium]